MQHNNLLPIINANTNKVHIVNNGRGGSVNIEKIGKGRGGNLGGEGICLTFL